MTVSSPDTLPQTQTICDPLGLGQLPQMQLIDLFFFAYRDFTAEADRQLALLDFGRAHHRALYFINRKPGMMVAELLDILAITKQSLSRVLRQLIDTGYIERREGDCDRRQRLLFPTARGRRLLLDLSQPQSARIAQALRQVSKADAAPPGTPGAEALVARFLEAMIDPPNERHMKNLP